ncbi:acyl-CoA dehydrogenase family protein [Kitasatospora sp. NPDC006697]|uniref:acyl-CoA dehydrogenase family protein n=1 Tax=Kitasatospora sp. NPDC006697 TaxID=3364020 RepID=UPI0036C9F603
MNLGLDGAQRQLVDAVAKSEAAAAPGASGWEVFDALGLADLLVPEPGGRPLLGTLEWCLVLEELGAGCRSHAEIRSVRTFLDVFAADGRPAAAAFRAWAAGQRAMPAADGVLVRRTAGGGWRIAAALPSMSGALTGPVGLDPTAARAVDDRELLVLAAYACGVARQCLESAQQRAGRRVVAGRRLLEHQGTGHRIARCAVDLTLARVGLWRAALGEDTGERAGHRAPAAAAACLSAALDCADAVVQVFGAAGTSDPHVVRLFRAAGALPGELGSPRRLWHEAGERRLALPI